MKRQNVRTLSLIVCTFTYLLVGAAVFDALESADETRQRQEYAYQEDAYRKSFGISEETWDNITMLIIRSKSYKAGTQWKFAGAFYFATTVITTIGYGHSTPKTISGKLFCMCYATPGIPLCIVMFQSIGERMNAFITFLLQTIKICFKMKNPKVSQTNLIIVSLNLGGLVLTLGAAAFCYYENWTYIEAFYYCYITLTTIGFGDFVALQRGNSLNEKPDYVAFSLIFILFGLTVVSSGMNLLVLRFLTMNTDDERRDEIEAAAAAREALCLEGDVISSNAMNDSLPKQSIDKTVLTFPLVQHDDISLNSVCSCTCYQAKSDTKAKSNCSTTTKALSSSSEAKNKNEKRKSRYTVRRKPGQVSHLMRMNAFRDCTTRESAEADDTEESDDARLCDYAHNLLDETICTEVPPTPNAIVMSSGVLLERKQIGNHSANHCVYDKEILLRLKQIHSHKYSYEHNMNWQKKRLSI